MKRKGILIDPVAKTVEPVEYEDTLEGLYTVLGCSMIEATGRGILPGRDVAYVDEEGLFAETKAWWRYNRTACRGAEHQWLANRGLIVGTDDEGENATPKTTLEQARAMVEFGDLTESEEPDPTVTIVEW